MLLALILGSFLVFAVPRTFRYLLTLVILTAGITATSYWSFPVLTGGGPAPDLRLQLPYLQVNLPLTIDRVSAFFIIVINITVFVGFLYAKGYLKPYTGSKNPLRFSMHYFSYLWLWLSMVLVVMIRDGIAFLIAWELMAVSSFMLVIFEAEDRAIMKTGISYLIQMHAGMFFILVSFLIVGKATGHMSFDSLRLYFSEHSNIFLFLLFFIGFGIKAGFVPFHTWLPEAHPAAPSHVSGVMSGVMIKMGIYGILRVLMSVQHELLAIGLIVLGISIVSGLFGVMMAIMQHDLKRLLAYHSIENIGIIGIGLGLGVTGMALGKPVLSILGFTGGILHILNHSLFKSLLFFSAGSVYKSTHTRNIEQMGGLMKKMPFTAALFLVGSISICGLPPFNGFISEFILYTGLFKSLPSAGLNHSILLLLTIIGLVLIGGLAIFCFTKAFGITFLGDPRSEKAARAEEVSTSMVLPQVITLVIMLLIGLASPLFVKPLFNLAAGAFSLSSSEVASIPALASLSQISLISGIFITVTMILLIWRYYHLSVLRVDYGPTWGCGYTAGTSKQQYTATSYTYNYNHLAKPLLRTKKIMDDLGEDEIFPSERTFEQHSDDAFKSVLIDKPVDMVSGLLKKLAMMQTGEIRHYILYAFIFMLLVLLLTFFNLI